MQAERLSSRVTDRMSAAVVAVNEALLDGEHAVGDEGDEVISIIVIMH